jgi:hypothetical protein
MTMDATKRKALETAGFRLGDAGDFLGLDDGERALVELRLRLSRAVKLRRQLRNLTQVQAARQVKSSQSRIAKVEAGQEGVSLDLSFRMLFAMGGTLADLADAPSRKKPALSRSARRP